MFIKKWIEKRKKSSEEKNEFDKVLGTVDEEGMFDD
jgi:hypothetical protein